jgi:hypothetical protein
MPAIFEASWSSLNRQLHARLHEVIDAAQLFSMRSNEDAELAYLFVLEGRRIRSDRKDLELSRG